MDRQSAVTTRGTDVKALWLEANAERAAQIPSEPALVVGGKTVAMLGTALDAVQGLNDAVSVAEGELSKRRSALRALTDKVDRNNKRWYLAWLAEYLPGTPEHDALSLIDMGSPAGGGGSSSSSSSSSSSGGAVPGAPQNFTLQSGPAGSGEVVASSEPPDPADNVTEARLYSGGSLVASGPSFPLTVGGLNPGDSVTWVGVYVNAAGESDPSDPGTATAG
jgi:hypothetical protein